MNELMKLLDNRWDVELHRLVDGKYQAAAKSVGKSWRETLTMVKANGDEATHDSIMEGDFRYKYPRQIATGDTPDEACRNLVKQLLG